jgi:hypothetical protein
VHCLQIWHLPCWPAGWLPWLTAADEMEGHTHTHAKRKFPLPHISSSSRSIHLTLPTPHIFAYCVAIAVQLSAAHCLRHHNKVTHPSFSFCLLLRIAAPQSPFRGRALIEAKASVSWAASFTAPGIDHVEGRWRSRWVFLLVTASKLDGASKVSIPKRNELT